MTLRPRLRRALALNVTIARACHLRLRGNDVTCYWFFADCNNNVLCVCRRDA